MTLNKLNLKDIKAVFEWDAFKNSVFTLISVLIWAVMFSLVIYVGYRIFVPVSISKSLPKDISMLVEFDVNKISTLEGVFPWSIKPWFFSYEKYIQNAERWAIFDYKWEKVAALLIKKPYAKSFLASIATDPDGIDTTWDLYKSRSWNIPPCIYHNNVLFCSKSERTLSELQNDKTTLYQNDEFLNVKNNLYSNNNVFAYGSSEAFNDLLLLRGKFKSIWLSTKNILWIEEWILYWFKNNFALLWEMTSKKRKFDLESQIDGNNLVFAYWWVNLESQLNDLIVEANKINPYSLLLTKWIFNAEIKDIFWSDFDLFKDIMPLFSWEFVIALNKEKDQYVLDIVAEKNQPIEPFIAWLKSEAKKLQPKQESYQFENVMLDQIGVDKDVVEITDITENSKEIKWWQVRWNTWWLYISEYDWLIRLSTSITSIKKSLSSISSPLSSLLPPSPYSYEFGYINADKTNLALSTFGLEERLPLGKNISWQTIWFQDWIQTKFRIWWDLATK